jgi:hypothetical protein
MSELGQWIEIVLFLFFIAIFCLGLIFILKRSMEWLADELWEADEDDSHD